MLESRQLQLIVRHTCASRASALSSVCALITAGNNSLARLLLLLKEQHASDSGAVLHLQDAGARV